MREWKVWDWIGYVALGMAATVQAIDTGLKQLGANAGFAAPLLASAIWGFAPLGLLLLASAILLYRAVRGTTRPLHEPGAFAHWPEKYEPKLIRGKSFANETVHLDGYAYIECEFSHVTLHYNGTTGAQIRGCTFIGRPGFSSDNPAVLGTMMMLYGLGMLPDARLLNIPPGLEVTPMQPHDGKPLAADGQSSGT